MTPSTSWTWLMLCACSRYEHQCHLVQGGEDGVRWPHKHDCSLLTHTVCTCPATGRHGYMLWWLAVPGECPAAPLRCISKVWEQGMVCPVCPLFWPLTCHHANPCARLADTLQSLPCVGELGERRRLSLVHQAPTTVNAYCADARLCVLGMCTLCLE